MLNSNKNIAMSYGFTQKNKSYVFGFQDFKTSHYLKKCINTDILPKIISNIDESVYVTNIHIPVKAISKKEIFKVQKIETCEFMDFPLKKNVGIIYIMDYIERTNYNNKFIEFNSMIIEPLNDLKVYAENLVF
jgi:hypothetical protein